MKRDPLFFIEFMWGLRVERDNTKFVKGSHISWQQAEMIEAVRQAACDEATPQISVSAGRGIGKTAWLSWMILWGLWCHTDAQIACTAPTSEQIHDILWKEIAIWLGRLKPEIRNLFEWRERYVRVKQRPETWFASAKTGRKENPEALAGVHGPFVMLVADEASGVPEEIFKTAESGLTDEKYILILISNYRWLTGFFHDSHRRDRQNWQTFQFSALDSPLRSDDRIAKIREKYGDDSDEFRVEVLGLPPNEESIDEGGFVPLLRESDLRFIPRASFGKKQKLGNDIAGEGKDETVWIKRDNFAAQILRREKISEPKSVAQKTATILLDHEIDDTDCYLDGFGIGSNAVKELALAGHNIQNINSGDKAEDEERYLNRRAEMAWRVREWLRTGGELVGTLEDWRDLLTIKWRRNLRGKIQIMAKDTMRKCGIGSPDIFDALALTFAENDDMDDLADELAARKIAVERLRRPQNFCG